MSEGPGACANCGHAMIRFRMDRKRVRERDIELQWAICPQCRHVCLTDWMWLAPEAPESLRPDPVGLLR